MQSIHLYSISPFKCKQTFINNIWEYGHSFLHTASALCWENMLGGAHSNLSGDLGVSNHISLEAIHRSTAPFLETMGIHLQTLQRTDLRKGHLPT